MASDTRPFVARTLTANPASAGWWLWYIVLRRPRRVLIGEAGFKGPPDADGAVETGYALIEQWRGHRYAGEAVSGLCDWAFRDQRVQRVIGRTYPHLVASIRTMERNKFRRVGPPDSNGIITFVRERSSRP